MSNRNASDDRPVAVMTLGELLDAFERRRREAEAPVPRRLYTDEEIGEAIGVSGRQVRRLMAQGMPYVRIGAAARRMDLDECIAWLREHGAEDSGGRR